MNIKSLLIIMTWIAVLSDTMLHPFYPQYFQTVFHLSDPRHVGYYFGSICFMVMISFPFWAAISRKINELNILVVTQAIAGVLAIGCYYIESYLWFWIVSLLMIIFKGSYLLVYPYILSIEDKENHGNTIGLLSVIVHFGSILGAVLGGLIVGSMNPKYIFIVMASGDLVQMAVSYYLLSSSDKIKVKKTEPANSIRNESLTLPAGFILKLGIITFIFYFSIYIINPFFSLYWEMISSNHNKILSGTIYAIPGLVAVLALFINKKLKKKSKNYHGIIPSLFTAIAGIFLQASQIDLLVVLSRVIYGWAIFQASVKFDVLLFDLSSPGTYASDYSKIHFFQNAGVLVSSFAAGIMVEENGLQAPFFAAFAGLGIAIVIYYFIFKSEIYKKKQLGLTEK